jgi:hypothetical protein
MNETDTQTRRRLTDDQLEHVVGLCADPGDGWVRAIVAVFDAFDHDLLDPEGPKIPPWSVAIPIDQWNAIGAAMAKGALAEPELNRVSHLLDWGNYGPSAFEPEEENQ